MPDPATERLAALLAPLTNYERDRPDRPRWSLDTMRALLARPGAGRVAGRVVQVGGSKGKGTVAAYLEALARAAGLRTGLYQSPHLESLLERVQVDGAPVAEAELRPVLDALLAWAADAGAAPSFFEVMTGAAVEVWARAGVELAALEVGLGGRLDATTAVPVDATVLTSIELEHTEILGDTVEAIAGEKAAIQRPGVPSFSAVDGPAGDVIERAARAVGAPFVRLGRELRLELQGPAPAIGERWCGRLTLPGGRVLPFAVPAIAAAHELPALALAVAALDAVHPGRDWPLDPVPRPVLPGRVETVAMSDGGVVVLDGAHTTHSLRALADELRRRYPGRRVDFLIAFARGKRWRDGSGELAAVADSFVVTTLQDTPSEDPAVIAAALRAQGLAAVAEPELDAAIARWRRRPGALQAVAGSFYLAGAVRARLRAGAAGARPEAGR